MSSTKLSVTLSALASSHPPQTFYTFLSRGVYPVLDALPATLRYKLEANLKAIQREVLSGSGHGTEGQEEQGCHTRKLRELIADFNGRPTVEIYKELVPLSEGNAQIYLEKGLGTAFLVLQGEIHQDYPDLEKTMIHLEGKFEELKLPKQFIFDMTLTAFEMYRKREDVLSRFVQLAQHYHTEDKALGRRVRFKEEYDGINIAEEIRGWAAILDDWPNKVEVKEIRQNLGIRTNDPFYAIDGVARILAESSAHDNVAESIMAAYDGFGPRRNPEICACGQRKESCSTVQHCKLE